MKNTGKRGASSIQEGSKGIMEGSRMLKGYCRRRLVKWHRQDNSGISFNIKHLA